MFSAVPKKQTKAKNHNGLHIPSQNQMYLVVEYLHIVLIASLKAAKCNMLSLTCSVLGAALRISSKVVAEL